MRNSRRRPWGTSASGTAHIQAGQYTPALKELLEAEKLTPNDPTVHYYLGIAYERKGFIDDAVKEFQKAIALKPDYSEAHNFLGTIYLTRGNYDEAIVSFNRALINPLYETPSVPLYNMGRAYKAKGDVRAAYASFSEAIRKEPNSHLMFAAGAEPGGHRLPGGFIPRKRKSIWPGPLNGRPISSRGITGSG